MPLWNNCKISEISKFNLEFEGQGHGQFGYSSTALSLDWQFLTNITLLSPAITKQ